MSPFSKSVTEPTKCRSCGAEILWVETEAGKKMPVDATPDMRDINRGGGTLILVLRGGVHGKLVSRQYDPKFDDYRRNRYTSHFATCPNADEHRRNR